MIAIVSTKDVVPNSEEGTEIIRVVSATVSNWGIWGIGEFWNLGIWEFEEFEEFGEFGEFWNLGI